MRIRLLHAASYASLQGRTLGPLDEEGPVVFLGRNESGKSTLRRALQSLLFGFEPAQVATHPDRPWEGERLELHAVLVDRHGEEWHVQRSLGNRPKSELRHNGVLQRLGNRPLPLLRGLNRRVFDSLYCLDLRDLACLDERVQDQLQDRILGGELEPSLRPAREVLEELRREAMALVRVDRRGKPRERELLLELKQLKNELVATRAHRQETFSLVAEQGRLEQEMRELETTRRHAQRLLDLTSVARGLARIGQLREEACRRAPAGIPADLPEDPAAERKHREQELTRVQADREELAERCQQLQRDLRTFVQDQDFRENEDRLEACLRELNRIPDREERATLHESAAAARECHARQRAQELFLLGDATLPAAVHNTLLSPRFSLEELRRCVRAWQHARLLHERLELRRLAQPIAPELTSSLVAMGLAGLAISVLGMGRGDAFTSVLGGLTLAAGVWIALRTLRRRRRRATQTERETSTLPDPQADLHRVQELLHGLPLREVHRSNPDESLVEELGRLRHDLRESAREVEQTKTVHKKVQRSLQGALELCDDLGLPGSNAPRELRKRLTVYQRTAEGRRLAAERARQELPLTEQRQEQRNQLQTTLQSDHGRQEAELCEAFGVTDFDTACRHLREVRELLQSAEHAERELHRNHRDLADQRLQIEELAQSSPPPSWSLEEEERRRDRCELIDAERQRKERRAGECAQLLLREGRSPADVEGEIVALERQLETVRNTFDSLQVLECVLRIARRRYRETHQPDVLRRASRLLAELTEGRYDRVLWEEQDARFHLSGPALDSRTRPLDAPFSQGTVDQVQLALRLALAEHFDRERGEPLPLLLDEALVNFDPGRLDQALRVLARVARRSQVFLLTCHPWFATRAEQVAGARILEINKPEARAHSAGR